MKNSPMRFCLELLLLLADWLAIFIIAMPIIELCGNQPIGNQPQHMKLLDILFSVALFALPLLYLACRYKRYTRLLFHNIGRIIYQSIAVLFYLSAVVTTLSLLSRMGDSIKSFLTVPIGLKPDAQLGDFGGAFEFFLIITAILGVIYLVAKYFRGVGSEANDLLTTLTSPKPASFTKE